MSDERYREIKEGEFKFFADKLYDLIAERYKSIIFLAQLLIALLIIASFSEVIIPRDYVAHLKGLIIFLLLLVPIMLVDYSLKINEGINAFSKFIGFEGLDKRRGIKIIDGSNYLYLFVVVAVIDIGVFISLVASNIFLSIFIIGVQLILIYILIEEYKKRAHI